MRYDWGSAFDNTNIWIGIIFYRCIISLILNYFISHKCHIIFCIIWIIKQKSICVILFLFDDICCVDCVHMIWSFEILNSFVLNLTKILVSLVHYIQFEVLGIWNLENTIFRVRHYKIGYLVVESQDINSSVRVKKC